MTKEISKKQITALSFGGFSKGILTGIITTFLLTFFIPTDASTQLIIYIPAAAVSMAAIRGIGMIWDAITDPLIANLSDKCKHKDGRRIPFMKWAAVPYAIFCVLIFFPPVNDTSMTNVVWVGIMMILYYTFSTLYIVPYMALQTEVVSDSSKRVYLYTIDSVMYVVSSAIIYGTFAIKAALMSGGISEVWAFRIPFIVFGIIGLIASLVPVWTIKEKDYVEPKDCYMPILESLKATFHYKNFSILAIGYLVMWVAFAFFNAALAYYVKNLLGQSDTFVTIVLAISIVFNVIFAPILNKLVKKIGKKPMLIAANCMYVFLYICIYNYQFLLQFIDGQIFGILLGILIAPCVCTTNIVPAAAFADLAQYDQIQTGETRAGMFVAARNFTNKLSQSIVFFIVPSVLLLGSTDGIATTYGIQLTAIIAAIFVATAVVIFAFYNDKDVTSAIAKWNEENSSK